MHQFISKSSLKNFVLFFTINPIKKLRKIYNKRNKKKSCYVCKNTFDSFTKYRGGTKKSHFSRIMNRIGSDTNNFGCMYCGSHDRERHLFMFFDKLEIWNKMQNAHILHFAPEKNMLLKINMQNPLTYIKADLFPENNNIKKIDITSTSFKKESFDFVIANHVLEHVPDYLSALREIYRILKPHGIAILQTPYSQEIDYNFEARSIQTEKIRLHYYGQEDHVRVFSEKHLFSDLKNIGFKLKIHKNGDFFTELESIYYGVNQREDLVIATK